MEPTASRGLKMHYEMELKLNIEILVEDLGYDFGTDGTISVEITFETSNKELIDMELKSTDERLYVSKITKMTGLPAKGSKPICDVEIVIELQRFATANLATSLEGLCYGIRLRRNLLMILKRI